MTRNEAAPLRPIVADEIPWQEWSDVPNFSVRFRHLTQAALGDNYHVGVAIEELPPGRQTAPLHYHIFEEEHVYMLEGSLTLRLGDRTYPMKAGDYVCFPAAQPAGHCLINTGDAPCRYVIVGERNPNEISVYPDTNKVSLRALGPGSIFDMAARRGYWEGENTGLPAGAAPPDHAAGAVPAARTEPKPPISESDVAWEETNQGSRFSGHARHLTYAAVGRDYHVGMLIEAPAPGKRLAPMHYHMLEEEQALILEGEVTLLIGDERHVMRPGDYVCFPAGRKVGHSFLNSGNGPCRYLMIGERKAADICVYPDSNKMAVAGLRTEQDIFDMSGVRRYWDGEVTG